MEKLKGILNKVVTKADPNNLSISKNEMETWLNILMYGRDVKK